MKLKQLGLVLVTALIIGIAWKVSEDKAPQTEVERAAFFPQLLNQVNDIKRMTLHSAQQETRLRRQGDAWLIENKDGFTADAGAVKRAILQLAALRSIEAKTSSADRYARLAVNAIDDDDAEGTRVTLENADSAALVDLIVGKARDNAAAEQHYVRRVDAQQAWLVEGALTLPADPIRWLEAKIADIDTARIRTVTITTPGETPITIDKAEPSDNFFSLANIPEGFEAKSKASTSSIGAILLDLRFNDVAAAKRIGDSSPIRHIEVRTFDGLVVNMDEYKLDEQTFVRFGFAYDASAVVAAPPSVAAADVDSAAVEDQPVDAAQAAAGSADAPAPAVSVADEATRLDTLTRDWVYVLPDYKRRMVERDFDSLVKPVAETQAATE